HIGTNNGLSIVNNKSQTTVTNVDIIDPYSLQTSDILGMGQRKRQKRKRTNEDEPLCSTSRVLQQPTKKRLRWRDRHCHKLRLDPIGTQYLAQESTATSKRIPTEYKHLGQCKCVCRHCGAMFLECEKVTSASRTSDFGYNKCCYRGRITFRPPPDYPQYIKNLYEKHLMENIRAYN
ncbi:hypothetical protein Tco_1551308, partial [Tanacetum coccineum]